MSRPSARSCLYTSSAERCRTLEVSNRLMILSRGTVALRPASLRSLGEVISASSSSVPACGRGREGRPVGGSRTAIMPLPAKHHSRHVSLPRSLHGVVTPFLRLAVISALVASAGCATTNQYFPTLRSLGVYKLDINQ